MSPTSVGILEDGPGRDCFNATFLFLPDGLPHTAYALLVSALTQIYMYIRKFTSSEGFLSFFGLPQILTFGAVLFKSQLISTLMVRFRVSPLTMILSYLGVSGLLTAELKGAVFRTRESHGVITRRVPRLMIILPTIPLPLPDKGGG